MCFFVTATRNVALFLLAVLSCVAVAKRNDQEHSLFLQGWTGPLLLATVALSTLSDVNGTILVSASLWKHRKDNVTPCVLFVLSLVGGADGKRLGRDIA